MKIDEAGQAVIEAARTVVLNAYDRAERCWGWTDALDWVLAMMDRAAER